MLGSPYDWIVILVVVAVVFFGASKIPEIFRSMGRAVGEFKKGRIESELELQQMQQAFTQQSLNQPLVKQEPQDKAKELEEKIQELQKQLDELKKQSNK